MHHGTGHKHEIRKTSLEMFTPDWSLVWQRVRAAARPKGIKTHEVGGRPLETFSAPIFRCFRVMFGHNSHFPCVAAHPHAP